MSSFSIPVKSFRKLPNPVEENGTVTYEFYCLVKDVPGLEEIPMDTNPRDQQLTSAVAKDIQESLKSENHNMFHILNKGITLSADKVMFDNQTNEVYVSFEDPSIHGNIDGGHSLKIVLNNQFDPFAASKYVKFEVITGLDSDNFVSIAEARNTAAKVETYTIAELQNKFDIIKDALEGEEFLERVSFKQFEDKNNKQKDIPVRQITAVLNLFNIEKWSDENHPIPSYSGKQATVKYYLDAYSELELDDNPYYKMRDIMKDMFRIHAEIDKRYKDFYNKGSRNYLRNKFAKLDQEEGSRRVRFSNSVETVNFKVPDGILLPIVGSFRALIKEENGKFTWIKDPFEYIEEIVPKMMNVIAEKLRNNGVNPQSAGKDASLWLTLYMMVEQKLLKDSIGI